MNKETVILEKVTDMGERLAGIEQHLKDMNGKMIDFNDFKKDCPTRQKSIHDRINRLILIISGFTITLCVGIIGFLLKETIKYLFVG